MGTIGLLLDGLMVVLLAMAIASMWVLSARLKYVRDSRAEFEATIRAFDDASKRADSGLKSLQAAASKSGDGLQQQLDRARSLRDELSIMIESADSLARRLEAASGAVRAAEPLRASSSEPARDVRSKAELDLLRAMTGGPRKEGSL